MRLEERTLITAIIPSKDRPERVRLLLDDLHRQDISGDRLELMVIDDGSSPAYEMDGVRILRHEQPLGAQRSRNEGMKEAKGDIILMLDDDIEIEQTDFIRQAIALLQNKPDIVLVCGKKLDVIHGADNQEMKSFEFSMSKPRFYSGDLVRTSQDHAGPVDWPCNCYFVRRRELLAIGGYDGIYGLNGGHSFREESDVHARLRRQGGILWFTPEIMFKHHILPTGGHGPAVGSRLYWIAHNHIIFLRRHIRFWPIRAVGFLIDVVRYSWVQGRFRYTGSMLRGWLAGWRNALRDRVCGNNTWLESLK